MKRILLSLAIFALLFPAAERTNAGVSVSLNLFYDNLDGGSWLDVADYGYCWQPAVAVNDANWRPYSDGYWAYTDVGWTWVSYEPFGWATYHYGRWARLADYGWVWVPGTEWGPAWVSWRTGGDYVGWAPLPPRRRGYREPIYEGRPITGFVDIEFDIGPAYYNFCDVRYIGEPVLRHRIFAPTQNITYINQTVNVTNITYNNNVVYNHGPDYNYLSAYSARPIQRLRLRRETNVDALAAVRANAVTQVQGDQLVVAAPPRLERSQEAAAPRVVKAKVEQPKIETGWVGIANQDAKERLLEKMRKEDRKAIPPPKVEPTNPAALAGASPPAATGSPAAVADANAPAAAASPSPAETAPAALPPGQQDKDAARRTAVEQRLRERENRKGKPDAATAGAPGTSPAAQQEVPGVSPPAVADAGASPAQQPAKPDKDAARRAAIEQRLRAGGKKKGERDAAPPAPSLGEASAAAESAPPGGSAPASEEASADQKKGARGARGVVGPGMPTRQNELQDQVPPPNFPPAGKDGRAVNKHRFPDAAGQAEATDSAREQ
ncbi:MAG TPA: DUF6600 domain-containing protein, partial [Chthoniobacterales bacterium]|nr:DUF6600 domain-containing protein [Chthoniobacterales bacterium]